MYSNVKFNFKASLFACMHVYVTANMDNQLVYLSFFVFFVVLFYNF